MAIERAYAFTDLFALVRAGTAWRFDETGALVEVAANGLRVDHDPVTLAARGALIEEEELNQVPNPRFEGAVAGIPGTVPSQQTWLTTGAGLTRQIVGVGSEAGLPYVDVRWSGTPSSTTNRTHNFVTATGVVALSGQSWASRVAARVMAGSTTNVTVTHSLVGLDGGGALLDQVNNVITGKVSAANLPEAVDDASIGLANGATAYVQHRIILGFTNGQPADITLRMAVLGLWRAALSFSPSYPPVGVPGASLRSADDMSAIDIDRWFNPAQGTFVIDVTPGQTVGGDLRGIIALDDGTTSNRISLRLLQANTNARLLVDVGGVAVATIDQATGAALARQTIRFSYGPAGVLMSCNGAAPVSAAAAVPPGILRALFGRRTPTTQYLNGWLGPRLDYHPIQYTDTPAADGFTIRTR